MDYEKAKEINKKRLEEGTHISKGLQEIYNLKKLESNIEVELNFEELYQELKDFYDNPMHLAAQLSCREEIIKTDLKRYNKDLIIFK